jgi:hypothetical protein
MIPGLNWRKNNQKIDQEIGKKINPGKAGLALPGFNNFEEFIRLQTADSTPETESIQPFPE